MITRESKAKILYILQKIGDLTTEEKQYFNLVLETAKKNGGTKAAELLR